MQLRPPARRRRAMLAGTVFCVFAVLPSCTLRETAHFKVTSGWNISTQVYQRATFGITNIFWSVTCHYDFGCLSLKMREYSNNDHNLMRAVDLGEFWFENVRGIEASQWGGPPWYCLKNERDYFTGSAGGRWSTNWPLIAASCRPGEWPM